MLRFKNLRIVFKILAALVIIVVMVGVGSLYAVFQMHRVDAQYSEFLRTDAKAAIDAADLQRLGYSLAAMLYQLNDTTDPAKMTAIGDQIGKLADEAKAYASALKQLTPEHAGDADALNASFLDGFAKAQKITAMITRGQRILASTAIRDQVEPVMLTFNERAATLRNSISGGLESKVSALSQGAWLGMMVTMAIGTAVLAVGVLLAFLIAHFGIARPAAMLAALMERIVHGDYDLEVPGQERRDELGAMSRSVEVFRRNGIDTERLKAEQVETEQRAIAEKKQLMHDLATSFEESVGEVVRSVSTASEQINQGAVLLADAAEKASSQAESVAASSVTTSTNVQTVSAATEEMSASISEIGKQVFDAQEVAGLAVKQAALTAEIVSRLAESAQRIGQVVELIDLIAAQTNLLALNATIEAARAGDAGRGFAVVASEVKTLASQTATATQEISGQISGVQGATREAVQAIYGISTTIEQIKQITISIATAVEQQTAATHEIARSVEHAATGTETVTRSMGAVSEAAANTGSAAEQMRASSTTLAGSATTLRQEVDGFIARVRAA